MNEISLSVIGCIIGLWIGLGICSLGIWKRDDDFLSMFWGIVGICSGLILFVCTY